VAWPTTVLLLGLFRQRNHGGVVGYNRATAHQLHHGGVAGGFGRLSLIRAMDEAGESFPPLGQRLWRLALPEGDIELLRRGRLLN
jgi:hypothetical protein